MPKGRKKKDTPVGKSVSYTADAIAERGSVNCLSEKKDEAASFRQIENTDPATSTTGAIAKPEEENDLSLVSSVESQAPGEHYGCETGISEEHKTVSDGKGKKETKGKKFKKKEIIEDLRIRLQSNEEMTASLKEYYDQSLIKLEQEKQARIRSDRELNQIRTSFKQLEERLENERLSRLSIEHDLRAKEETIAEHRRLLEQERQEKNRELLQERSNLGQCRANLERERAARNQESRNHQRAANESEQRIRDLQQRIRHLFFVALQPGYHRPEPRDWIIRRDEVQLSERRLGVGGWGTVCEGTFRGCQVAVKQIHELILSPHNRRLFEREMSIASRCRHPNLLQFIGATNDDGSPLFITELLDTDLRKILSQRALLQEEIVCIALDVARALNYLHLNKPFPIIHRDISSSNVLLWRRDDSWRAKLSDYGAANFMRQCMTANPGALIYASPESVTSQQSPKADVFSFGLLLCEMCLRELPVPQQIQDQINRVSYGVLRKLIMRCVETNPEARPSMSDVISVLLQPTESLPAQGLVSINGRPG